MKVLIVFVNLLVLAACYNQLLVEKLPQHEIELRNLIRHILLNYCYYCNFIAVVSDLVDNKHDLKTLILRDAFSSNRPIIMTNKVHDFTLNLMINDKYLGTTQLMIVLVGDIKTDKFAWMVTGIRFMCYDTKTNIAFVFYKPIMQSDTIWLEKLLKIVWDNFVLRAIAVFWNEHSSNIEVVTFDPYQNNFYINLTEVAYYEILFYDKVQNMHGYPLIIVAHPFLQYMLQRKPSLRFMGKDELIVYTIIKHLNATGVVAKHRENAVESSTKILDRYDLDGIDIVFEAGSAKKEIFLEGLYPHEQDDLCVVVPRGEAIPQALYLFMIFEINAWCSFFLTIILGSLGYFFLNKFMANRCMRLVTVNIIRVTLIGPWVHLPHDSAERILICSWALFGFLVSSFFMSELTSTLIEKKYYPDVTTLKELESTNWKIYGSTKDVNMVKENYKTFSHAFLNRFINLSFKDVLTLNSKNTRNTFPKTIIYQTIARMRQPVLMSKEKAVHFLHSKESYAQGRRAFSLMPECPFPNQVSYSVTKGRGTIYAAKVNEIIKRLYMSGIIDHWKQIAEMFNSDDNEMKQYIQIEEKENNYLSLFHLQTAFYILAIGLALSIFAFCMEITYVFLKKHGKRVVEENKNKKMANKKINSDKK